MRGTIVITEGDALEPAFDVLAPVGFETEDLGGGLVGLSFDADGRTYVVTESEMGEGFLLGIYTEQGWREGEQALEYRDELDAAAVLDAVVLATAARA